LSPSKTVEHALTSPKTATATEVRKNETGYFTESLL
jgi:hypothetical protein